MTETNTSEFTKLEKGKYKLVESRTQEHIVDRPSALLYRDRLLGQQASLNKQLEQINSMLARVQEIVADLEADEKAGDIPPVQ